MTPRGGKSMEKGRNKQWVNGKEKAFAVGGGLGGGWGGGRVGGGGGGGGGGVGEKGLRNAN